MAIWEEAEGLIMLELYEEAWELVDRLPPEDRTTPPALRIRLICAMATQRFDMAEHLALFLADAGEDEAKFAARILHELAAILYMTGDVPRSKRLIAAAVRAYPDQRFSIIEDPQLKHLF